MKAMADRVQSAFRAEELERLIRDTEPSAFLVPPRILRRVISHERKLSFLSRQLSHRKSYVLPAESLRAVVEPGEIGLPPGAQWPETAILLVRPDAEELAERPRAGILVEYWRLLFQARIRIEVQRHAADAAWIEKRIERIGRIAFAEARSILRQDGVLLPPRNDTEAYVEFAAAFLDLRYFSPAALAHVFPAIEDAEEVEAVIADEVDAARLVEATRLPGAPGPRQAAVVVEELIEASADDESDDDGGGDADVGLDRWLIVRADRVAARGNLVRSAILWAQVARRHTASLGRRARLAARGDIERLSRRLQAALDFNDAEFDRWRHALPALLGRAAKGFWKPEARLLYDLQKVCVDHERDVFTVDLVEWLRSLGRRPIKRSLPHLRAVLVLKHLRAAVHRLPATKLHRDERGRLENLLQPAFERAEGALRAEFEPIVGTALAEAGFQAHNLPERVALNKLVQELLDRIVDRGYLTIGNLRDACSRSQLKLPDLSSIPEAIRGNRLLQADAKLAERLDGVHRRGEIYLRGLQRMSALAFATPFGRFLTRYGVLPFGGTFVLLEGLHHIIAVFHVDVEMVTKSSVLILGTMALGLVNFPRFRRAVLAYLALAGRLLRVLFVDLPCRIAQLPMVRKMLGSRAVVRLWRYLGKPLVVLAPLISIGWEMRIPWYGGAPAAAAAFAIFSVLINSRAGRDAEEIFAEGAARLWRRLSIDLVPVLVRMILEVFQRFLEVVERLLYAVDELLRFRTGQRRWSVAFKAVFGFVWFFVAYLVRFYVNLLIEPQVNPIKHFPVVTVSHKIILPMSIKLTRWMEAFLAPLGKVVASFLAWSTVFLLPGVFGFLVWELKENWRLYQANRSASLRPTMVGSHGETLVRLLRPGFHSGTLPKIFARLRRAERESIGSRTDRAVFKCRESLHHVELDVRRFLDRELLALMRWSRTLGPVGFQVGEISLATNCIRVELRAIVDPALPLHLSLLEESGVLAAELTWPCGPLELTPSQHRMLAVALAGFFKLSGVDVAPELDSAELREVIVNPLAPPNAQGKGAGGPTFAELAIPWQRWVEAWQAEGAPDRLTDQAPKPSPIAITGP
jgi:hypothetical protein